MQLLCHLGQVPVENGRARLCTDRAPTSWHPSWQAARVRLAWSLILPVMRAPPFLFLPSTGGTSAATASLSR